MYQNFNKGPDKGVILYVTGNSFLKSEVRFFIKPSENSIQRFEYPEKML